MPKQNTEEVKSRILPLLASGMLPSDIVEHVAKLAAPQTLVSCGQDKTVKMWDIRTGECKRTLTGHTDIVTCIAPYRDRTFFTGSNDCTIGEWDGTTGKCIRVLKGHKHYVKCLCALAERRVPVIVSGSRDRTIVAWRICSESPQVEAVIEVGGLFGVNALASAEHDTVLISGDDDGHIRLWDTATWKEIPTTITGHNSAVQSIRVIERGSETLVITCGGDGDRTVKVWDMHSGECLHVFRGHVSGVWSADFVSVSGDDDSIRLLTVSDGEALVRTIHREKEKGKKKKKGGYEEDDEEEDPVNLFKSMDLYWNTSTEINAVAFAQYCDPDTAAAWNIVAGDGEREPARIGTPRNEESENLDMCPLALARGKKIFMWSFPQMKKGIELVGHTGFVYDLCFLPL